MITNLYERYFQKSKSFLYPALGISKLNFQPIKTFIGMDDVYKPEDRKLICLFDHKETLRYEEFEKRLLYGNPLYHDSRITPGGKSIYIFDFSSHAKDWDLFLKGKYSKLSEELKETIRTYYGEHTQEYSFMDTYLYPENYYILYSELLEVDPAAIMATGELCNPYDLEKETLIFSNISLEKSKETI